MQVERREIKIGTLACRLWGHNFISSKRVFAPHYLDLVKKGVAVFLCSSDYYLESIRVEHCVRCGFIPCK